MSDRFREAHKDIHHTASPFSTINIFSDFSIFYKILIIKDFSTNVIIKTKTVMIKKQNELLLEVKEKHTKKEYASPTIEVTMIEMEEGFATGSATVTPAINENTNVDTDTQTFDWDPFTP
ncbi:hypothetical protein [Elizabethkingia meningoseptica]|uniref:hypothetical protein n=1 Tax=Elizabethkingia meningoseptica TaxID=238 RepID=UPI001E350A8F|nr:hypothetical protein [Elizabethkingia meningoseptica]